MTVRAWFAGILLSISLVGTGRADERAVKKIEAADSAALAAYQAGDATRAKDQLLEAIVIGKENGLETHAVMAQVYLHLGAVQAEGLKDEEKAGRYFGLALRIQPDIRASGPLATPTVERALQRARQGAAAPAPAVDPRAQAAAAEARAREKQTATILREQERQNQEREQKARVEREKLGKDLAVLQDRERRERDLREQVEKQKQELEKQLAEARDREKKERDEKDRLQRANQDLEKQLAELRDREKKERESREQIQTQDRERQERVSQDKLSRDKLREGPVLPTSVPQPVFCPTEAEWSPGVDVFVHCAAQSQVKAKELALYYRPSGALHYNSLLMERSKKGWYVAAIPAAQVTGRMLQYYVEARGPKGEVAAVNGKPTSPNIMMIRARPSADGSQAPGKLTTASAASGAAKARSARRERGKGR